MSRPVWISADSSLTVQDHLDLMKLRDNGVKTAEALWMLILLVERHTVFSREQILAMSDAELVPISMELFADFSSRPKQDLQQASIVIDEMLRRIKP